MGALFGYRSACFAIAAGLAPLGSFAADEASPVSDGRVLEEVIVTAQKREERLIDVPAVITAIKADTLTNQNVEQIRDYYSRIPGLGYNGSATYDLSLRGITTGGVLNPTLAILVDDIQFGSSTQRGLGNSRFPDFDPAMLERIEVLHGPQGTLYGAASLGGLIKFVTRQPDTEQFSGRVEAGFESVQGGGTGWTTRGSVNLPLVSEKVALSVSGFTREDPPYLDNVKAGQQANDVNTAHTYGGHAALLLKPIDNLTITLSALEQKRRADFASAIQVQENANGIPNYVPVYGENKISLGPTSDIGDQQLYSARIVLDLDGLQLTSLTAYGKSAGTNFQDVSSVFTFLGPVYGYPTGASVSIDDAAATNKISQELRLTGKAGPVDWRGGLYYTRENGSLDQSLTVFAPSGSQVATAFTSKGPDVYKERAVFGDIVYHMTDRWDLQAGARYAKNDQVTGSSNTVDGPAQVIFGPSSVTPNTTSSDTSTTWEISPIYHFSPDLMAYARSATGYRPGGPNPVLPNVPSSFAPDKVIDYEVGFKGILPDRTFSWDAALFQINWQHVQLADTAASEFNYTTNGGGARSRGAELALDWKPYRGLSIEATATFLDAILTETLPTLAGGATGLVGQAGDRLPVSARFSSNLFVQQDFPLAASLTGFVSANWSFVGTRESEFVSTLPDSSPRFQLPSYSLIDLRAGVNYRSSWHLNVFLRNLTNKEAVVTADNRNGTSTTTATFLQPRTVGFSIATDF
jgi:outer membrane receptor protein involved in Fe transport